MATEKRLIDANSYKNVLEKWESDASATHDWGVVSTIEDCIWELDAQPTVDAAEVVHGHWKLFGITGKDSSVPYVKYAYAECSNCREVESSVLYSRRFCPNCGAMKDRWTDETY